MVREMAAATPGVELMLGQTVTRAAARRRRGARRRRRATATAPRPSFEAPLTIGADGRDSRVAKLSGVKVKTYPHGRFAYGGYFDGPTPKGAPDASIWMMDPDWAAAFPTDERPRLLRGDADQGRGCRSSRRDPEAALVDYFEAVPEAPLDPRGAGWSSAACSARST